MSRSTDQSKYDSLLNEFLQNDNLLEGKEDENLKRWLEEATNGIRSQFQEHRSMAADEFAMPVIEYDSLDTVARNVEYQHEDNERTGDIDELEAAMCVSLPSDSSDDEPLQMHEGVLSSLFYR